MTTQTDELKGVELQWTPEEIKSFTSQTFWVVSDPHGRVYWSTRQDPEKWPEHLPNDLAIDYAEDEPSTDEILIAQGEQSERCRVRQALFALKPMQSDSAAGRARMAMWREMMEAVEPRAVIAGAIE